MWEQYITIGNFQFKGSRVQGIASGIGADLVSPALCHTMWSIAFPTRKLLQFPMLNVNEPVVYNSARWFDWQKTIVLQYALIFMRCCLLNLANPCWWIVLSSHAIHNVMFLRSIESVSCTPKCLLLFSWTVSDIAGEVVEVGPEVKNFKAGDKVVAMLSTFVRIILLLFFFFALFYEALSYLVICEPAKGSFYWKGYGQSKKIYGKITRCNYLWFVNQSESFFFSSFALST